MSLRTPTPTPTDRTEVIRILERIMAECPSVGHQVRAAQALAQVYGLWLR